MITRDLILDDAARLDAEPAMVLAFAEVESNGSGFLPDGRPAILFEAQWFHHYTQGQFDGSHPNISSAVWDQSLYLGGGREWDRLNQAMALDAHAALMSASVGAFQVMGFNYAICGYPTVEAFWSALKQSLDAQIAAFTSFVAGNPELLTAVRTKDFKICARDYNGPGAVATYAAKLETAYRMHAKQDAAFVAAIPAPAEPLPAPVIDAPVPVAPPPPVIAGPPIPAADPSPPPAGYVEDPNTGNRMREDVNTSPIIKGAKVGQVVTGVATTAVTAATGAQAVKSVFGGFTPSDVGIIVMGVVAVVAMISALIYFGLIRRARTNMNRQGIA